MLDADRSSSYSELALGDPLAFGAFLQVLNATPLVRFVDPCEIWAVTRRLVMANPPRVEDAFAHVDNMAIPTVHGNALKKALRHPKLAAAIDDYLEFPIFQLQFSHLDIVTAADSAWVCTSSCV